MSYNHMRKQTSQLLSENEHSFFITSLTLCNIFLFKACDGQSKEKENFAESWVKLCLFFYMDIINTLTLKTAAV